MKKETLYIDDTLKRHNIISSRVIYCNSFLVNRQNAPFYAIRINQTSYLYSSHTYVNGKAIKSIRFILIELQKMFAKLHYTILI